MGRLLGLGLFVVGCGPAIGAPGEGDGAGDSDGASGVDADAGALECFYDGPLVKTRVQLAGTTAQKPDNAAGSCGGEGGGEEAYRWTPTRSGCALIYARGSRFDQALYVLDDGCGGAEIACANDYDHTAALAIEVEADHPYTLVLDTAGGEGDYYQLQTEFLYAGPCEDECVSVGCGSQACADDDFWTDFMHDTTRGALDRSTGSCGGAGAPERRFVFTAEEPGVYVFKTNDDVGDYLDSVLYLRSGTCGGPEIACNDDLPGTAASGVVATLEAGETVVVVVDGHDTEGRPFTVSAKPLSDDCEGLELPLYDDQPSRLTSSTESSATNSIGFECGGYFSLDRRAWFTAPETGPYIFEVDADFPAVVAVVDGWQCSRAALHCTSSLDGQASLTVQLQAGQTVAAVVDGLAGRSGIFQLTVTPPGA